MKNKKVNKFPSSVKDLDDNHHPVARTYLELYPGGSGLRVSQYKYVKNSEFKECRADILCYEVGGLDIKYSPPLWVKDLNEDHVSSAEVFIENTQDGFCGPIISYYVRYHANNSYYS